MKRQTFPTAQGYRGFAVVLAFAVGLSAGATGCNNKDELCDPSYCGNTGTLYLCKPLTGFVKKECHPSETAAAFWCQSIGGSAAYRPSCDEGAGDESDGETGDSGDSSPAAPWEPSDNIMYNSRTGQYEIDTGFLSALKSDWSLTSRDDAYLAQTASGYYQILNVAPGSLADALGLQSRDILINVNGYDLGTLDNQLTAYIELEEDIEFLLTIARGTSSTRLVYVLVE